MANAYSLQFLMSVFYMLNCIRQFYVMPNCVSSYYVNCMLIDSVCHIYVNAICIYILLRLDS